MDFIQETSSPNLRASSTKRFSYNSRQSGDYISQVRSLPSSNPIKQPLLEQGIRNRVSSTENPRRTVIKELPALSKVNSNNNSDYGGNKIDLMAEDLNRKYKGLEDRLSLEVDRLNKDMKLKDMELENLREKLKQKEDALQDFEKKMEALNNVVVRKNEEFLRRFSEKHDLEVSLNKDDMIRQLQERNLRNEEFLEKANVLLREKDLQLQEMAGRIVALSTKTDQIPSIEESKYKLREELREKELLIKRLEETRDNSTKSTVLEDEIRKLSTIINDKDLTINTLNQKHQKLIESIEKTSKAHIFEDEIKKLSEIILEKDSIINVLKSKTEELQLENENLRSILSEKQENQLDLSIKPGATSKKFADFLQESHKKPTKDDSKEHLSYLSKASEEENIREKHQSKGEKTKKAFVGESQHLQETIKSLNLRLSEMKKKYEELLKEQNNAQNRTFLFKESLENKTIPPFERGTIGSTTTIFNDRFFGEQIQGIINKNRTLNEENQTLVSQKSLRLENVEKMNMISREKIQENERLKKKIEDQEGVIEDLKEKLGKQVNSMDIVNENLLLKSRLSDLEQTFSDRFEDNLLQMRSEFDSELQRVLSIVASDAQHLEQTFSAEFERKNNELRDLALELAGFKTFLEEMAGDDPKVKAFLLERSSDLSKRIEENSALIKGNIEAQHLTTTYSLNNSELAQERYHRMVLESLLGLLRKKLLELNHLEEVSEVLKEMEGFSVEEGNPFDDLQSQKQLIFEMSKELEWMKMQGSKENKGDSHEREQALSRALFFSGIENERLSKELGILRDEYQRIVDRSMEFEVRVMEAFGSKAVKMVRENQVHQIVKTPIAIHQSDHEVKIAALKRTVDTMSSELVDYKGKWMLIGESIDQAIEEKEEISGRVLTTYWSLKEENAEYKRDSEYLHFYEELNKKSHLLTMQTSELEQLKQKLMLFSEKLKPIEGGFEAELLEIIETHDIGVSKSKVVDLREKEIEDLRMKYVENALILEELRAENSGLRNSGGDIKNDYNNNNNNDNNSSIEDLKLENNELKEKIERFMMGSSNFNQENECLKKENDELRNKFALLENEINDLKELCVDERRQKELLLGEIDGLQVQNEGFVVKIKEITKENMDLKRDIETLKVKFKENREQNEKPSDISAEFKLKFDELKEKNTLLEEKLLLVETENKKNKEKAQSFDQANDEKARLLSELQELHVKNKETEEKFMFESLISRSQMENLKEQLGIVSVRLHEFEEESRRLSMENQELLIENKHFKTVPDRKIEELERRITELSNENNDLLGKINAFYLENQDIHAALGEMQQENLELKKGLYISEERTQILEGKLAEIGVKGGMTEEDMENVCRSIQEGIEGKGRRERAEILVQRGMKVDNKDLAQPIEVKEDFGQNKTYNRSILGQTIAEDIEEEEQKEDIMDKDMESNRIAQILVQGGRKEERDNLGMTGEEVREEEGTNENPTAMVNMQISNPMENLNDEDLNNRHKEELIHYNEIRRNIFNSVQNNSQVKEFFQYKLELLLNSHSKLTDFHRESSLHFRKKIDALQSKLTQMYSEKDSYEFKMSSMLAQSIALEAEISKLSLENNELKTKLAGIINEKEGIISKNRDLEGSLFRISQNQARIIAQYLNLILEIENRLRDNPEKSVKLTSVQLKVEDEDPFCGIFSRLATDIHELLDRFNEVSMRGDNRNNQSYNMERNEMMQHDHNMNEMMQHDHNRNQSSNIESYEMLQHSHNIVSQNNNNMERNEMMPRTQNINNSIESNEIMQRTHNILSQNNTNMERNEMMQRVLDENKSLSRDKVFFEEKLAEMVKSMQLLLAENEKLRNALDSLRISKEAQFEIFEITKSLKQRISDLETELDSKREENINLKKEKTTIEGRSYGEKQALGDQMRQLRTIMANLKEEVENCYKSLKEKREEREKLIITNEQLRARVLQLISRKHEV